jgi:membrane fusion protein, multidrug efflux system
MINEFPNQVPENPHQQILSEPPTENDLVADQPSPQNETLQKNETLKSSAAPSKKRVGLAVFGVLLLGTAGFFGIRSMPVSPDQAKKSRKEQVTPVTVATVTRKTVPIQLQTIGTVQAASTVSVTPQAGGRITGVFFKKGQEVKKGDLLFTLDDRTQAASIRQAQGTVAKDQAQVQQARATLAKDLGLVEQARTTLAKDQALVRQARAALAKDQAQAKFTIAQSDRYNNLLKQGAVSKDQAQQYSANAGVSAATLQSDREAIANAEAVVRGDQVAITNAEAVVQGDRAAIETAQAVVNSDIGALQSSQVQSSYTKIYAPISGRAGNILVTEGNVVQATSTSPLVTIAQIRPIQVSFSVPEENLPDIQKRSENGKLRVAVTFAGSNTPIDGLLSFVNNTVDNTTGTIQLIGDFANPQGNLFPGQFVNTTLTLAQEPNAIVVPAQAVQNGPNGQFVFVVQPDSTVENVPVTVSSSIGGLDVVQKGLQPGDQVVLDGQANLVSGSKIRVKQGAGSRRGDSGMTGDASPAASPAISPSAKGSSDASPSGGNDRSGAAGGDHFTQSTTHTQSTNATSTHKHRRHRSGGVSGGGSGGNQPTKSAGGDS